MNAPPKLRNGIVLGLVWGSAALGRGTGYPNNSQQIGDSRYYADSGWLLGSDEALLVLGALADYLNAGFWFQLGGYASKHQRMSEFGFGLRVEAFPFVHAKERLQGLGAFANFGLGAASLVDPATKDVRAQGTQSFIGAGVLYEIPFGHVLGGHFAIGPSLEYDSVFSRPFTENGLLGSIRFAFYGGP
jgi:hypothetical protein